MAAAAPVRVEVFHGSLDASFGTLVETALARSQGSLVAWVENDVLVPEWWLQHLIALLTAHDKIAVVGPMASAATPAQRVTEVPYRLARPRERTGATAETSLDTREVDRFARAFREANRGQWAQVDSLGGFCWVARRAALPGLELEMSVGEEGRLGVGRFRVRARQAGIALACCRDLVVHNFATMEAER